MSAMAERQAGPELAPSAHEQVSLCEALDRVLNKGVVVAGELTISVADIDLIYLGLQVVLTSIETGRRLAGGSSALAESPVTEAANGHH